MKMAAYNPVTYRQEPPDRDTLSRRKVIEMRKTRAYLCLLFAVPLQFASVGDAQENQASLSFQTKDGQSTFHIGERVPLELTFSSPNDTDYRIEPLIRGRGDEFDCNRFEVVSPAKGWSDPLEMYFKQDLMRTGHGWSWPPLIQSKPVTGSVDLNEWIRFDEPGDYTIKVTSFCVSKIKAPALHPLSGTIELHIVPATPEWQNEKFKWIQQNLDWYDKPTADQDEGESSQSQWQRRGELFESARADLKYLATPATIDEMTRRLRSEKYNFADQSSIGLEGLPPAMRETAIASMKKRIEEPDFPINQWFFSTLSFLHVTPGSEKDSIRKQHEAINPIIWSAIFSAVTKKEPAAKAETVQTLLAHGRNISTPEVRQQMAALLKLSFLDLDTRSQTDDLLNEWDRLRSPEFLPILRRLARVPVQGDSYEDFTYSWQQLKGMALKRWYELDPEGAHREIVAQIGSASPSLAAQSIAFLPDEQFPQFEPVWAQALLNTKSQLQERAIGSLLVRFGTGAATSQMIAKLDEKSGYPCDAHIVALAYMARFSPDLARKRFKHERATNEGKCDADLLRLISELTTAPVLNDLAVDDLSSSKPPEMIDGVRYLTAYGRKEDEAALWSRYVAWTEAYKNKANLLDKAGRSNWDSDFASSEIGEELGNAMLKNPGWFADPDLIARVLERCVGESMCRELKSAGRSAVSPYDLFILDQQMPLVGLPADNIVVAQYVTSSLKSFEEKISQFPAGSNFVLPRWYRPINSDEQKVDAEVRAILARHGMLLETAPH